MGFLDSQGLRRFWGKVRDALSQKQDALTADESIRLAEGKIGVALPTRAVTQAEYDALTGEERQAALFVITDAGTELADRGDVYSAEETRIGTWVDGKPLYRRVVPVTTGAVNTETVFAALPGIASVARLDFIATNTLGSQVSVLSTLGYIFLGSSGSLGGLVTVGVLAYCPGHVVIEYTKTADLEAAS